jgi:hypothetical protein
MPAEPIDTEALYDILATTILRSVSEADKVVFADDGEHVVVGPVTRDGEQVAERYRLGEAAQRFLMGEFPPDELPDQVDLLLEPPRPLL